MEQLLCAQNNMHVAEKYQSAPGCGLGQKLSVLFSVTELTPQHSWLDRALFIPKSPGSPDLMAMLNKCLVRE
jgi:hypothetical protein